MKGSIYVSPTVLFSYSQDCLLKLSFLYCLTATSFLTPNKINIYWCIYLFLGYPIGLLVHSRTNTTLSFNYYSFIRQESLIIVMQLNSSATLLSVTASYLFLVFWLELHWVYRSRWGGKTSLQHWSFQSMHFQTFFCSYIVIVFWFFFVLASNLTNSD